ncbi:MAG: SpoIIE family protein phosphatase [Spirochaetes bacterium]|nr:SpoIIE family protein phosphatase [Spirochaetota bacterium]
MYSFYLFSFIPLVIFSLMVWTDIKRQPQYGKRADYLLISIIVFGLTGAVQFFFSNFAFINFLYFIGIYFLEYSIHSQRIKRSFVFDEFKQRITFLIVITVIMGILAAVSVFIPGYNNLFFYLSAAFALTGYIYCVTKMFAFPEGIIRKNNVQYLYAIVILLLSVFLKLYRNVPYFELFFILNVIYLYRLFKEYYYRKIHNINKQITDLKKIVDYKNKLVNRILNNTQEEDIKIIKKTVEDSIKEAAENLVFSDNRITGSVVYRRTGDILRVDSEDLIYGNCSPLFKMKYMNMLKEKERNEVIVKTTFNLSEIASRPIDAIPVFGEQLIKKILETKQPVSVDPVPSEFKGLQRLIVLYPVINEDKLTGIFVVFKHSTNRIFPVEERTIETIVEDLKVIFSLINGKAVQAERNRLQGEMKTAENIQTSIVPEEIILEGYDCAHLMITATEVGGDVYDFAASPQGYFLGIGDVSGHGLPAGITALIQLVAFQSIVAASRLLEKEIQPYQIYDIVNKVICEINKKRIGSDKFMTQNYLLLKDGVLHHAGAHVIALLYSHKEDKVLELDNFARKTAFLGLSDSITAVSSAGSIKIFPDDILVLYTDGVIEAKNNNSEQFGIDRLKKVILDNSSLSSREIMEKIVASVKEYAKSGDMKKYNGKLADDITLLILKKSEEEGGN